MWEFLWQSIGIYLIFGLKRLASVTAHLNTAPAWVAGRPELGADALTVPWYVQLTGVVLAVILVYLVGLFVGNLQSPSERRRAAATMSAFFEGMQHQGMIADYSVQIDDANNPAPRVALGYMQADVKVQYLSIVENFLVNVEGGQSVTISRGPAQLAA